MVSLMLSGCAAPVSRPLPAGDGPAGFERDGVAYQAEVRAGPVLAVSRAAPAFGYDEGLAAKRAGESFCASKGRRLDAGAYGHFVGGTWLFKGGCA